MRMLTYASAFASIVVLSSSSQGETLKEYAAACNSKMGGWIPGYSCKDGVLVNKAALLRSAGAENRLGRVKTINPNVDAIFLCRDFDAATNRARLNGYILQNNVTGDTCFFDAKPGGSGTVYSPNSAYADTYWVEPKDMEGDCQTCHAADAFITPYGLSGAMGALGMMTRGRNLRGAYEIVNNEVAGSVFFGWEKERQMTESGSNACKTCHKFAATSFYNQDAGISAGSDGGLLKLALDGNWMAKATYEFRSQPKASIGVWRPGLPAHFHLDADGNRVLNASDKISVFGETGDTPFVLAGPTCSAPTQRTSLGVVRAKQDWILSRNNLAQDDADLRFTLLKGEPTSWNGLATVFWSGVFFIDNDNDRTNFRNVGYSFGLSGDKPVVGRWVTGHGYRMGVFRNGYWYLDENGNNGWDAGVEGAHNFGGTSLYLPVTGDFDGDGLDEIGVFRDGIWYIDMNNNFTWDDVEGGDAQWKFGQKGDVPVVTPTKWDCSW